MKTDTNINLKFGKLTITKRDEDYVSPQGIHAKQYLCTCDCGNTRIVRLNYLTIGKVFACKECQRKQAALKLTKDLTGNRFGRWTVIKRNCKRKGVYWDCVCDCGNTGTVRGTALLSGGSLSCGCLNKEINRDRNLKDLTGLKFGRLTAIKIIGRNNKNRKIKWLCKCDCGKEVAVGATDLLSGNTKSCGCYKLERTSETHFKDLTGQKIGMLTIIKRVEDYVSPESGRPRPQFLCKCDCGNHKIITKDSLLNGTISCGCINSKGEREIADYLRKNKIDFKIQFAFDDLYGVGGAKLHFDFALFNKNKKIIALIEFQGEQHYEPVNFFGGKTKFEKQIANDRAKRQYCLRHSIPLIEISYKDSVEEKLSFLISK